MDELHQGALALCSAVSQHPTVTHHGTLGSGPWSLSG